MKGITATIPIDGEALKLCLKRKGYNAKEASLKLGYGQNFMTQQISREMVTESTAKLIDLVLDIPLGAYVMPAVPKKEEAKPEESNEILSELREIKQLLERLVEVWK